MEDKTLLFGVRDGVGHITLNRPESANTFNAEMIKDLLRAVSHFEDDRGVRALMISGAGKLFSGGGDLKTFAAAGKDLPALVRDAATYFHLVISRITRMGIPVIAAVHGAVAGGGLSLAIACAIVVDAEPNSFSVGYTRAGLTPDGGSTYFLPRAAGLKRALELTLTNRMFTAKEALEWGIITRVAPDNDLLAEAGKMASELAKGATRAFGVSKRLLHNGLTETLETQMETEAREISTSAGTREAQEGIRAFLEKRTPNFISPDAREDSDRRQP